jgi:hypothetical protein
MVSMCRWGTLRYGHTVCRVGLEGGATIYRVVGMLTATFSHVCVRGMLRVQADFALAETAVTAGARLVTHMYNAMPPLHQYGLLWWVLCMCQGQVLLL